METRGQWPYRSAGIRAMKIRFETSNLNYPGIHMHIATENHFHGLRGSSGLQMTSEATSEVRFELSGLNYLSSHDCLASNCHHSQNVPTPIPPPPPPTVPIRAIDQREREALPADKNRVVLEVG